MHEPLGAVIRGPLPVLQGLRRWTLHCTREGQGRTLQLLIQPDAKVVQADFIGCSQMLLGLAVKGPFTVQLGPLPQQRQGDHLAARQCWLWSSSITPLWRKTLGGLALRRAPDAPSPLHAIRRAGVTRSISPSEGHLSASPGSF